MEISQFKKIRISDIETETTPTDIATVGTDGRLRKSPITDVIFGGDVDGGSANSVYLSSQLTDGGSATI